MAPSQDLQPRTFNPEGVWKPPPTYHHVAVTPLLPSSRLITLAGLTGCDPASHNNPKTLPEQAKIAYSNVEACLAAAGATPRDIVQVSTPIMHPSLLPKLLAKEHATMMCVSAPATGQALHCQAHGRSQRRRHGYCGPRLGRLVDGIQYVDIALSHFPSRCPHDSPWTRQFPRERVPCFRLHQMHLGGAALCRRLFRGAVGVMAEATFKTPLPRRSRWVPCEWSSMLTRCMASGQSGGRTSATRHGGGRRQLSQERHLVRV